MDKRIFEGLKKDTSNLPVLVMPNNKGDLVSDTCGVACGAFLYQEQRGNLRLVGYTQRIYLQQKLDTVLMNLNYVD